jgi:glycerophosphoryl diester phosphodiesterase
MLPIKVPENFRIIAHRGASAYAPENSLPAFNLAYEMGAREFELDVQLSKDGKVFICHDNTLERYGHGNINPEDLSWSELSELDMGSWFSPYFFSKVKMIKLDALFENFKEKATYHVELKSDNLKIAVKTFEIIEQYGLADNCIVTSFIYENLLEMKKVAPNISLGWLVHEMNPETFDSATKIGLYQLCPKAVNVTALSVENARKFVSEIRAWGINGAPQDVIKLIRQCLDSGCDGMTINWPDWLTKI